MILFKINKNKKYNNYINKVYFGILIIRNNLGRREECKT
jgi:hypothetical protein